MKATLVFGTNEINAVVVKSIFLKAFSGGKEVNGIKIDPTFTHSKYA